MGIYTAEEGPLVVWHGSRGTIWLAQAQESGRTGFGSLGARSSAHLRGAVRGRRGTSSPSLVGRLSTWCACVLRFVDELELWFWARLELALALFWGLMGFLVARSIKH